MKMTGGEAVVGALEANGVDTLFGMPGVHNLAIYDALLDSGIRHIVARHEQGAAFMAEGYARASGRVGVCLVTSGPALLNTATPLGSAWCDSVPVLALASQIPSAAIGTEKGYIHECRDQLGCLQPVTAWVARADSVAAIPAVVEEAFARMTRGRPRPVAVEVPCDVLDSSDEIPPRDAPPMMEVPVPAAAQVERAAGMLRQARRPAILAGGGLITSGAATPLRRLAERLEAPVFTTILGKGSLPEDHPLAAGSCAVHPAAREYLAGCDAVLAVGTRFTDEETVGFQMRLPGLIHLDIDPAELGRNYEPEIGITGDAGAFLTALLDELGGAPPEPANAISPRSAEVARLRHFILEDSRAVEPDGVALVEILRAALPRETVIVSDLTLAAYWCRRLLDVYEPRSYVYPWGFCTLGFGLPAGIGAKLARPEQPVVVIAGDGGFMFNCQELAVAAQFGIEIVVLVFNNGGFGVMKPQQEQRYGRTLAVDLANPDFVMLARSFGLRGRRVDRLDELGPALTEALAGGCWVIEVTLPVPLQVMEPAPRLLHEALKSG